MFPTLRRDRLAVVVVLTAGSFVTALAGRQGLPTPPPPAGQGQTQPAAPPEGTGAISGIVVDGATDRPLAGAVVTLTGRGSAGRSGGIPTTRQSTDDRGRFIFTKLPASESYLVNAVKIGFLEARSNRAIALADGQWFTDAKVSLWKLGGITGVVTDESGEPVVGAFVRAVTQVFVSGLPQLASGPVARTDDRGMYRIPGLGPGKYFIAVPSSQWSVPADTPGIGPASPEMIAAAEAAGRGVPARNDRTVSPDGKNLLLLGAYPTPPPGPAGGRAMVYPITFYPAARSPRDAAVVELKNGENRAGIDLQIRPVAAVRVSGTVDAPADAEAAGMTLRLMPSGAEGLANGSEAAATLVTADGTFTFLNVPAGDYTIIASRQQMEFRTRSLLTLSSQTLPSPPTGPVSRGGGSSGGSSGGGTVASGSAGTDYYYQNSIGAQMYSGRILLTVGDRDLSSVVVPLKRAVSVSGRVLYEVTTPPADAGRAGLSRPVYAEPADGNAALGMLSGRVTGAGADTTFAIEGLQPGQYTLRFLTGGKVKSIVWDGKDYTNRPLDASGGRDIANVVVTMTDKTARLNGYVRDEKNQIAAHGAVIYFPVEPEQWSAYGFSPRRMASSPIGSNGAYSATNLSAGSYYLIAVDETLATAWQDPKFLAAAAPLASRVTLEWGESQTIDIMIRQVPGFRGSGGSEVPRF